MVMVKRKRLVELAVALLIIVPTMVLLWVPILTSDTKPWEVGDAIPREPPSEDRRILNEAGFSIVSPPNWTVRNGNGLLHMRPKQVITGRSKAGISVSVWPEMPQELEDTEIAEFQKQPAHRRIEQRRSTFDDPALTAWTYHFERGGQWIAVGYFIAEAHEEVPEMVKRYLETLRVE
jgi:hypothetical protein